MLRGLVLVLGVLVILVGVSLVIMPGWWLNMVKTSVDTSSIRLWSIAGIVFGVILLLAAAAREISMIWLMGIIGAISLVFGLVMIIEPSLFRSWTDTMFFNRPPHTQIMMAVIGGLVRIVLGALMIVAAVNRPVRVVISRGHGLPHAV